MDRPPLAISMGDPAGIGPELAAKAWARRREDKLPVFYWIGHPAYLRAVSDIPICEIAHPAEAAAAFDAALPVFAVAPHAPLSLGQPDSGHAPAIISAIDTGTAHALAGQAAGLVTAPIAKSILYQAGFKHPGHTEYLAHLCGVPAEDVVMLLTCPQLRVAPLTIHVPLAEVAARINRDLILRRARIMLAALRRDFDIARPVLAIAGLNPHAGEDGAIGREEIEIIVPAIRTLRAEGHHATGPHPADTLFHEDARRHYDAVLAMYHDQALIPIKTLDFHGGVNTSLGLPIVRASPDHGTAFNIAGQGKANPSSFIAALRLAAEMAASRARHG